MNIQQLPHFAPAAPTMGRPRIQSQETPPPPPPSTTMVDRIIDKTYLGANFTASTLSGGLAGVGACRVAKGDRSPPAPTEPYLCCSHTALQDDGL